MRVHIIFGLDFWSGPCDFGNAWGLRVVLLFWELVYVRQNQGEWVDFRIGKCR